MSEVSPQSGAVVAQRISSLTEEQQNEIRQAVFSVKIWGQKDWFTHFAKILGRYRVKIDVDDLDNMLKDPTFGELFWNAMGRQGGVDIFDIFKHPTFSASVAKKSVDQFQPAFPIGGDEKQATINAWKIPFLGRTAHLLLEALNDMNVKRKGLNYANFVPMVQSSGSGKSKTADRLAQLIPTFPFNLRDPKDTTGYPLADIGILACLNPQEITATQLEVRYLIFFRNLFDSFASVVDEFPTCDSLEMLATMLYDWIAVHRTQRYELIFYKTDEEVRNTKIPKFVNSASNSPEFPQSSTFKTQVSPETKTAASTTTTQSQGFNSEYNDFKKSQVDATQKSGRNLMHIIKKKSGLALESDQPVSQRKNDSNNGPPPKPVCLVMYFDESHSLTSTIPRSDNRKGFSSYQILCSVINDFRDLDLFAIFLSTNSKISVYSPPQAFFWSGRVKNEETDGLQTPFVELVFDEWVEPLLREHQHTLMEVCQPGFMVRFGRPLFWSRYQAGDPQVQADIIEFAKIKLAGMYKDGQITEDAKLAMLAVRVGLSFTQERLKARLTEDRLVEGHMRLVFSVPSHREYIRAAAPSEPIIAEAAARLMNDHHLDDGLPDVLYDWCNHGLIAKGERGELIARLLLTKAHDQVILQNSSRGFYTEPIFLVDFLAQLVGEQEMKNILKATPDNTANGLPLADSRLAKAQMNFTHWAKAGDRSAVTDEAAWIALGRCFAWQCFDQQEDVDLITPIMLSPDEKLGRHNVSAIFWQIKNRPMRQRIDINAENLKFFSSTPEGVGFDKEAADSRPYLTIILNLGVQDVKPKSKAKTTQPHKEPDKSKIKPVSVSPAKVRQSPRKQSSSAIHPRYAISISGCSSSVFPEIIKSGEEGKYRSILATGDHMDEHARPDRGFREAIVQMKPIWKQGTGGLGSYNGVERTKPSRLGEAIDVPEVHHAIEIKRFQEGSRGGFSNWDGDEDEGLNDDLVTEEKAKEDEVKGGTRAQVQDTNLSGVPAEEGTVAADGNTTSVRSRKRVKTR